MCGRSFSPWHGTRRLVLRRSSARSSEDGSHASQPTTHPCSVIRVCVAKPRGQCTLLGCYLEAADVEHEDERSQECPTGGQERRPCDEQETQAYVHGVAGHSIHPRVDQGRRLLG